MFNLIYKKVISLMIGFGVVISGISFVPSFARADNGLHLGLGIRGEANHGLHLGLKTGMHAKAHKDKDENNDSVLVNAQGDSDAVKTALKDFRQAVKNANTTHKI